MIILLSLTLLICLVIGMPIVFTLGIPGVLYIVLQDIPRVMIPQKMFTGTDVYVLMALPMFIIAGNLMNRGGISNRLVNFASACVGFLRGGLAMVTVLASMFFGGVTGAGTAEVAAMGSIMIPAMRKQGYPAGFASAVTTVASTCGPIIPPSILFIVYGYIAHVSIGKLFLAGFVPGVLIAVSLMITVGILSKRRNYPKGVPFSLKNICVEFSKAFWSLSLPVLIVAGMIFGILSPTEVSVLAVVLAILIGVYVHKELKWNEIPAIIIESAILSGSVLFIIATNNLLLYAFTLEQVAEALGHLLFAVTNNQIIMLLLINLVLLLLGAVIDNLPLMIMVMPVLLPIFKSMHLDPIHAGVFVVLNMTIAMSTPPVGTSLFVGASIARCSLQEVTRYIGPFLFAAIVVLLLITYIPWLTLVVPNMLMD